MILPEQITTEAPPSVEKEAPSKNMEDLHILDDLKYLLFDDLKHQLFVDDDDDSGDETVSTRLSTSFDASSRASGSLESSSSLSPVKKSPLFWVDSSPDRDGDERADSLPLSSFKLSFQDQDDEDSDMDDNSCHDLLRYADEVAHSPPDAVRPSRGGASLWRTSSFLRSVNRVEEEFQAALTEGHTLRFELEDCQERLSEKFHQFTSLVHTVSSQRYHMDILSKRVEETEQENKLLKQERDMWRHSSETAQEHLIKLQDQANEFDSILQQVDHKKRQMKFERAALQERETSCQRQMRAFERKLADVVQSSEVREVQARAELEAEDQHIAQLELRLQVSQSTHTMDLDIIRDKIFSLSDQVKLLKGANHRLHEDNRRLVEDNTSLHQQHVQLSTEKMSLQQTQLEEESEAVLALQEPPPELEESKSDDESLRSSMWGEIVHTLTSEAKHDSNVAHYRPEVKKMPSMSREELKRDIEWDLHNSELARTKEQPTTQREELDLTKSELQKTQDQLTTQQEGLDSTKGELRKAREQLEIQKGEIEASRGEAVETQEKLLSAQEEEGALVMAQEKLELRERELDSARSKLAETRQQLGSTRLELADAQDQLGLRDGELGSARSELAESLETLVKLKKGLATLGLGLFDAQKQATEYKRGLEHARKAYVYIQKQLEEHKVQLRSSKRALAETQMHVAERDEELKSARNGLVDAHMQLAEERERMEITRSQLSDTQIRLEDLQRGGIEQANVTHANDLERAGGVRYKTLEDKCEEIKNLVHLLNKERKAVMGVHENPKQRLGLQKSQLIEKCNQESSLRSSLANHRAEAERANNGLSETQMHLNALQENFDALQRNNHKLQVETAELSRLFDTTREQEKQLVELIANLEQQCELGLAREFTLRGELGVCKKSKVELAKTAQEEIQQHLGSVGKEMEDTRLQNLVESETKIASLRNKLENSRDLNEELETQSQMLAQKLESVQLNFREQGSELSVLKSRLEDGASKEEMLHTEMKEGQAQIESARAEYADLQKRNESLEMDLKDTKNVKERDHDELTQAIKLLKTKLADIKKESEERESSLNDELDQNTASTKSLSEKLENRMQYIQDLEQERDQLATELSSLQALIHQQQERIQNIGLELSQSKDCSDTLESSLQQELGDFKQKAESFGLELKESQRKSQLLEQEMDSMLRAITVNLRGERVSLEQELETSKETKLSLESKLYSLEQNLTKRTASGMFQELTALKTKAALATKSQEALVRSQSLMDDLQTANSSLEQTKTELLEQNQALKASLDCERQQTNSLQTSTAQDANNAHNSMVTLQIKVQEFQKEIAQLLCEKRRLEDGIDVLRAELSTVIFRSG